MDKKEHLKGVVRKAKEVIEGVDWWKVRFIPDGANDPLPPIPREIEFSDREIQAAIDRFDKNNPEWAGLLDAEVFYRKDYDGET